MDKQKIIHSYIPMVFIFGLGMLLSSCQSSTTPQTQTKSSVLQVKATAAPSVGTGATSLADIAVSGGTIAINNANLNLSKFILEENTGQNNQNEGNNQNGEQDSDDNGNDNEKDNESENEKDAEDIVVQGPFSINLNQNVTELATVEVSAGVFKQADLIFELADTAPFKGHSIVVEGTFIQDQGSAVPFKIQAKFQNMLQIPLVDKGLNITSNSVVPVVVRFDLSQWVQNLDWVNATKTDGTILIDKNTNTVLHNTFLKNLAQNTDFEREK